MPIPSSTASFANIQTELGGTNPISLSEYYNVSGKFGFGITGIPVSGQISVNNFRGKSKIINVGISGSGFTIISATNNSNYAYFRNNATFIIDNVLNCDIFIIGGGGGAGFNHGSGGGAGAYYFGTNKTLNLGTYNINIGSGGAGGTQYTAPVSGGDSFITFNSSDLIFNSLNVRCKGGGAGGYYSSAVGIAGGCGGGADGWDNNVNTNTTYSGGGTNNTGTIGSGFAGGSARQNYSAGILGAGGGGGIGGVGQNSINEGGNGGNGMVINITGIEQVYGGGGGGGEWPAYTANPGGTGGGATLTNGTFIKVGGDAVRSEGANGGDAVVNTGSGGGGGKGGRGGNGSTGLIIIKYKNTLNNLYTILKDSNGNNINPTAWYKFDNNTNIGLDSSGNGYNLTYNGSVFLDTTNFIKGTSSCLLNGTNNLQRAYTGNLFSDQSGWSLSFWVYLKKPTNLVSLISTRLSDGSTLRGFNFYYNNFGDITFQVGNDLSYNWYYPIGFTNFYSDGVNFKWFHFVITMRSGEQKFYSNGLLISTGNIAEIPNFQNGSSTFTIGSASYGDFFVENGFRYDDVRYYGGGRILTQAHVSQLYNGVS